MAHDRQKSNESVRSTRAKPSTPRSRLTMVVLARKLAELEYRLRRIEEAWYALGQMHS